MSENSEDILYREKRVAFYSALVQAWINTRIEIDKQLLALSSLGLGGLIAFASNIKQPLEFYFWFSASLIFLITILLLLLIFSLSADAAMKQIDSPGCTDGDVCLKALDNIAKFFFLVAVILTFVLAVSQVSNIVFIKEIKSQPVERIDYD